MTEAGKLTTPTRSDMNPPMCRHDIAAIEAEAICGHEQKPGRWAFLDVETGEWIEVKPGVVWGAALEADHD